MIANFIRRVGARLLREIKGEQRAAVAAAAKETAAPETQPLPSVQAITTEPEIPARVFAFTSSSGEVFDYIFGIQDRYRSHWASGWSARGFLKPENCDYVLDCLEAAQGRSQDIILLQFGNTDVQFNVSHRMQSGNFLDPREFCQEVARGMAVLVARLRAAGFDQVYCVAAAPPAPMPGSYYSRVFSLPGVPARYQAQLLLHIRDLMAADQTINLIDTTPAMANDKGVLKRVFHRPFQDHHADYIQIQDLVWDHIREIPGMPPRSEVRPDDLYVHRPRMIRYLMENKILEPTDIAARQKLGIDPRLVKAREAQAVKAAEAARVANEQAEAAPKGQ